MISIFHCSDGYHAHLILDIISQAIHISGNFFIIALPMTCPDVQFVEFFSVFFHCHQLLSQVLHPPEQSNLIISRDEFSSTTRRSEGPRQHRIFPLPLARRTLNGSSISLSGNLHPQQTLMGSPLYTWEIGLRNFANPVVKRWSLESPKPETVNADLSFSLSGFSLSRFRRSRCRETCLLDSRIPICRNSDTLASFDFSTLLHFICRDFRLRGIANPDAMFSELHSTNLRNGQRS
jgi:hypothetical protein